MAEVVVNDRVGVTVWQAPEIDVELFVCICTILYGTCASNDCADISPQAFDHGRTHEAVGSGRHTSTRMGGHFVQGHVDGTGLIVSLDPEGDSLWVKVKTGKELLKYIVPKGFIAVDGTSLTVVDVFDDEECFSFMLVEYTQKKVVIPLKKIGQKVNLEVDILGKYVERLLSSGFVDFLKLT